MFPVTTDGEATIKITDKNDPHQLHTIRAFFDKHREDALGITVMVDGVFQVYGHIAINHDGKLELYFPHGSGKPFWGTWELDSER